MQLKSSVYLSGKTWLHLSHFYLVQTHMFDSKSIKNSFASHVLFCFFKWYHKTMTPFGREKKTREKIIREKSLTLCLICIQAFVMVSTPLGGTLTDSIDIHQGERLI